MEHKAAVKLIDHPNLERKAATRWADLGCGRGTFTKALADLLGEGSQIYAVDTNEAALQTIPATYAGVQVERYRADFVRDDWPDQLEGILMANSLHFVAEQSAFLERLRQQLKPEGKLILVEYDTDKANPWVPYPRKLEGWRELMLEVGFSDVSEIGRRSSRYGRAEIVGIWVE
ncbi:MAG: class I SAM-dependent methyltransferase [Bacteroidota bacterium]